MDQNLEEVVTPKKKPRKKSINSKKKGSAFERTVVKILEEHFIDKKFSRSNGSGAMIGGQNAYRAANFDNRALELMTSDVVCISGPFIYSVEAKNYNAFDGLTRLINGNSKIYEWFNQAATDAIRANKRPLLIFKYNRTDIYSVCDISSLKDLDFKHVLLDSNKVLSQVELMLPKLAFIYD